MDDSFYVFPSVNTALSIGIAGVFFFFLTLGVCVRKYYCWRLLWKIDGKCVYGLSFLLETILLRERGSGGKKSAGYLKIENFLMELGG